MGKPYSVDLRERIVGYVEQGHSARAAARVFGVSASSAVRFAAARRRHGSVAPKPQGRRRGTVGKLAAHIGFLLERVKAAPDVTLQELAAALREARGVEVQLSSIHRALIRAGYGRTCRTIRQSATQGNETRQNTVTLCNGTTGWAPA